MPARDHHLENPRLAVSGLLQTGARSPTNLNGEPTHGANCGHGNPRRVAIGIPQPSPLRVQRTSHPLIAWRTRQSLSTVELENAAGTAAGTFAIEERHIAKTDGRLVAGPSAHLAGSNATPILSCTLGLIPKTATQPRMNPLESEDADSTLQATANRPATCEDAS